MEKMYFSFAEFTQTAVVREKKSLAYIFNKHFALEMNNVFSFWGAVYEAPKKFCTFLFSRWIFVEETLFYERSSRSSVSIGYSFHNRCFANFFV